MNRFSKNFIKNFQFSYKCHCRKFNGRENMGFSERKKNYYEILGVPKTATKKEIRNAYVELSKKFHPDSSSGLAGTSADSKKLHEKFVEINEAYRILSKPESRAEYDKSLEDPYYQIRQQQQQQQQEYRQRYGSYQQYQQRREDDYYEMMKKFYEQHGYTPPPKWKVEEMQKAQERIWTYFIIGIFILAILQFVWQSQMYGRERDRYRRRYPEVLTPREMEERERQWYAILREEEAKRQKKTYDSSKKPEEPYRQPPDQKEPPP